MKFARRRQNVPNSRLGVAGAVVGDRLYDLEPPKDNIWDFVLMNRKYREESAGKESATPGPIVIEDSTYTHDRFMQLVGSYTLLASSGRSRPLTDAELIEPYPAWAMRSFRDFYAFEDHVRNARRNRGLEMIPEWYEAPTFYFSNCRSIVGPSSAIKKLPETQCLDYELEIGFLIGKLGSDIPIECADDYVAGFTIINDWSMRDIQRREMKVGLGPCKSKDFATSIGPWLVTPDELEDRVIDRTRGKRYDLTMTASVNGKEYSRGNTKDIHWTFAELIAEASRNTQLLPGDLIGSGTVGTGCITEFPEGTYPWLQPGDVVRLEIEGLGVLENKIV
jgi:fumarylacetoacetate (FAA) hydrolase